MTAAIPLGLGHLYFIKNIGDYHIGGEVVGFCLVGKTDTVTEYVVANRYYVLGYHITALVQEGICPGGFGK